MKVGIIGASFAKAAYLPALKHVEGAEVVALASARLESAQKTAAEFGVPAAYDNWEKMIDAHELDLVCIATPTDTHAPMTLTAISKGAAVLCEKPTAMHAGEAKDMLDAAEAAGIVHMIDHELRFNPNRMKAQNMIAAGDLGEIRHLNISNIASSWANPASRPKGDWWSLAERGGGRLGANGSHQTDMVRWWLGEVAAVSGQALTMVPNRVDPKTGERWTATADDMTYYAMEMQSGALVNIMMSGVAGHNFNNTTQVFGSEGTLILDNATERMQFAKSGEAFTDIQIDDPNAGLEGVNKGIWNVSVVALMQELCTAITEKRAPKQGASFVDGWKNQLVLDAVVKSTKQRRWVDL